jgi:hypothetical protein
VDRRKLVSRLLNSRGHLLVIASIGSPTYDVAACGDNPRNFYIWSGLGCTPTVLVEALVQRLLGVGAWRRRCSG